MRSKQLFNVSGELSRHFYVWETRPFMHGVEPELSTGAAGVVEGVVVGPFNTAWEMVWSQQHCRRRRHYHLG